MFSRIQSIWVLPRMHGSTGTIHHAGAVRIHQELGGAFVMEYEQIPSFPKSQKFQTERTLSVLFLRKMWPLFVQVSGEINTVPEKTHSQNPGYSPAREEGSGVAPTASPTRWGLALFSTEMVFMCHLFFFSNRIFSQLLFSILFDRLSQSLFTASLQLELSFPQR